MLARLQNCKLDVFNAILSQCNSITSHQHFLFIIRLEELVAKTHSLCLLRRKETECCVQHCRDLLKPCAMVSIIFEDFIRFVRVNVSQDSFY